MDAAFKRWFPVLLKAVVHLGGVLPLLLLVRDALTGNLTVNPIQAAEQRTGDAAIALLMASLACTPLWIVFGGVMSRAVRHRRALGLYAFGYAMLHLGIFLGLDYGLDWGLIWDTVREKPYILAGLTAFAALLVLAVTSFRWWMRRLGKNWTRLHRLVYPAGGLVVLHFAWAAKGDLALLNGDIRRPLIYAALLSVLLALRLPPVRRFFQGRRRRTILRPGRTQPPFETN